MSDENQNQQSSPSNQPSVKKTSEGLGGKEVTTSHTTASEMVSAQTKAEVESGFALAKLNPRNDEVSRTKIVTSCKNLRFAEKCIYKKPVGKKKIGNNWEQQYVEGPSIRFAEEMLRHWGNIKIQETKIYDDQARRIVRVTVYDLETNQSYSEDIIIEKTVERKSAYNREVVGERTNTNNEVIHIVKATEDEIRNKEKALVSKAIRNNGLRLIPAHIVDEAVDVAKEVIIAQVDKDPMAVLRKMLNSFSALGISVEDIEGLLRHKVDQTSPNEIAHLQSIYNSIRDGEAKWSDYLEDGETKDEAESADMGDPAANWDAGVKDIAPGSEEEHQDVTKPQSKGKTK